jgi:hypothetical protein
VQVVDDANFQRHQGFDLNHLSEYPASQPWQFFKSLVSKTIGYDEPQFCFWVLANHQNKTVRPDISVLEGEPTLSSVCSAQMSRAKSFFPSEE